MSPPVLFPASLPAMFATSAVILVLFVVLPLTVVLLSSARCRMAVLALYLACRRVNEEAIMFPSPTNVTVWLPVLSAFTVCAGLVPVSYSHLTLPSMRHEEYSLLAVLVNNPASISHVLAAATDCVILLSSVTER